MKLFLIQPTSFLHFTFQSLFKMGEVSGWLCGDLLAWVEPWQVGALATMIECKTMVGSALKVNENTHRGYQGYRHCSSWTVSSEFWAANPLVPGTALAQSWSPVEALMGLWSWWDPAGSWGWAAQCQYRFWGAGGTKIDWEKELENMEKVLSTPSSGSTPLGAVSHVDSLGMLRCDTGQQCLSLFGSGWKDKHFSLQQPGACCHCWCLCWHWTLLL